MKAQSALLRIAVAVFVSVFAGPAFVQRRQREGEAAIDTRNNRVLIYNAPIRQEEGSQPGAGPARGCSARAHRSHDGQVEPTEAMVFERGGDTSVSPDPSNLLMVR